MTAVGGGGRPSGSPAPESDKHVCHGAQGWTLSCPSLPALTGTRGPGEVRLLRKQGDRAWGEVGGFRKVKYS